ncbi:hypothetical protein FLM48_06630 [Shewanella sp. Scap07]|uniref:hypothetical protein n=1 Tax=Shewanella sp. Scap07 TaxID=2589987 RepID=UPI0015B87CFD|nr:hypothetical protein [Shewanella sp. Scap07]QLE84787.1 hypothetical protein FLM48_06630 [Shewanella sp. Scap07]
MSWQKIDKRIGAHSLMALDAHTCLEYGVKLPANFPFNKVKFTCQALAMLAKLNDFDQQMVIKDIFSVYHHPNAPSSVKHSRNPFRRLWRTKYPFRTYHFLIRYEQASSGINIEDILFDKQLSGPKERFAAERTMLYEVKRTSIATYNKAMDKDGIEEIEGAWGNEPKPTARVNTAHAAVNGMQNSVTKATWLMGTHLDTAYKGDGIQAYTLFHNPTDSVKLDLVECVFDKRQGRKSHNAQHLAAVLAQNNQQGKSVKWVAHSQGVIVFNAALEHYRIHYRAQLKGVELAVHGSGANIDQLKRIASSLGVKIISIRNNPYDLVPNLAGRNDVSSSSLVRSARFAKHVFGDEVGASPHTLPFLGLETYADQLAMLGNRDKAAEVKKFIRQLPKVDPRI